MVMWTLATANLTPWLSENEVKTRITMFFLKAEVGEEFFSFLLFYCWLSIRKIDVMKSCCYAICIVVNRLVRGKCLNSSNMSKEKWDHLVMHGVQEYGYNEYEKKKPSSHVFILCCLQMRISIWTVALY